MKLQFKFEVDDFNSAKCVEDFIHLSSSRLLSSSPLLSLSPDELKELMYPICSKVHKVFKGIQTYYNEGTLTEDMIERFNKEYEDLPALQKVWEYIKDLLNNMYNYICNEDNMSTYTLRDIAKGLKTTGKSQKEQIQVF